MKVPTSFASHFSFIFSQTASRMLFRAVLGIFTMFAILLTCPAGSAQTDAERITTEPIVNVPTPGQVQEMKLLAPSVGWVLQQNRLYWTEDNGQDWADITPMSQGAQIGNVYFKNPSHGWAVLYGMPDGNAAPAIQFAITKNHGMNWQIESFDSGVLPPPEDISGVSSLFFVSEDEGWMVLRLISSSNFSLGVLLRTTDGGITWKHMPIPPAASPIVFVTSKVGWMAGGATGDGLWLTEDTGLSWEPRSVPQPYSCSPCRSRYSLPEFMNDNEGAISVDFLGDLSSTTELFITSDRGRSWSKKESYTLPEVGSGRVITSRANTEPFRVISGHEGVSVLTKATRYSSTLPLGLKANGIVSQAAFIDALNGWAIYATGECTASKRSCNQSRDLMATKDGGKSFTLITPTAKAGAVSPLSPTTNVSQDEIPDVRAAAYPEATGESVSTHMGFDTACVTSTTNMDTWYADSPYYDSSVYLGGENATCKPYQNSYLSSSWVSEVLGKGWGLMPLWVGPQAPCQTGCSTCGNMGTSTSYESQGSAEADSALSAASSFGITSGVIYYDMEPYPTTSPTCSSAVQQFLSGWVSEIHSKSNSAFLAGVYDVHTNAADFEQVSPTPDAVWLAYLRGESYSTPPTVSELNKFISGYWTGDQRIMQYCQDGTGAGSTYYCSTYGGDGPWGGFSEAIDGDVEDGPVVTGATAAQTPTATTGSATSITTNSATLNGTVNPNGADTNIWFQWGTSNSLSGASQSSSLDIGSGTTASGFSATPIGLTAGTLYYFRVVAQNSAGTTNGTINSFTTTASAQIPTVSTGGSANITSSGASVGGIVNPNGADTQAWFQYATNSSLTGASTTMQQDLGSGTSNLAYNAILSGLSANTLYYFRAAASNASGTTYGSTSSFTTTASAQIPTVSTGGSANITSSGASVGGIVNPNGADTQAWFQYATNSSLTGASTTMQQDLGSGTSNLAYNAILSGLSANTLYYFRATASNASGTTYGSTSSFTTSAAVKTTPTVQVVPTPTSITTAQQLSVAVTVIATSGNPTPTGWVVLVAGTGSFNGNLVNGVATIPVPAGAFAIGTDQLTATYSPDSTSSSIYTIATGTANVTVTAPVKTTPTVNVSPSQSSIPAGQSLSVAVRINATSGNPTPTGSVILLAGTGSFSGPLVNGVATISVPASALSVGSNSLYATYQGDSNYNTASGSSSVTVTAAVKTTPTVTVTPLASSITTTQPLTVAVAVNGGSGNPTPTGSVTLSGGGYTSSAITLSSGSATFNIPAESLSIGSDTLIASYSGDSNYTAATSAPANVTVSEATQTITFTPLPSPVRYGVTPITLSASASSGLPVAFSVIGPATVSGNLLTITGAGIVEVTAMQAGNSNYAAAASVSHTMTVGKASLTIHAINASIAYNQPIPTLTYTLTGFVNGDTASVVSGEPLETTTAEQGSALGTYPIHISQGTLTAANYGGWATLNATLTVIQSPQSISFTPLPTPVKYGVAPITLSVSASSGLPVTLTVAGPATLYGAVLTITGVGTVEVTAKQAGNSDYEAATSVTHAMTVGKASLTIHANNASAGLDWTIPKLTYALTGFVNGETASVVSGAPVETTTATKGSPLGNYPITITQGTLAATNYGGWATVNGILSIKQQQTITFTQPTSPVRYGVSPITLSASASSGLPVTLSVTGPATLNGNTLTITGVGTVVIRANQAGNSIYTVAAQVVQEVIVDRASLTIHATSASVGYNQPIPALTYTLTGFVNGDTPSVVSGAPVETTTATQGSTVGNYPITITQGTLAATNYGGWATVYGTLTITQ